MGNKTQITAGNGPITVAPVAAPGETAKIKPEFIRLPKPGSHCPVSGLSRSYLNSLILPTEANGKQPPVKSVPLRQSGAKKGIRLISYDSLISYLRSLPMDTTEENPDTTPPPR